MDNVIEKLVFHTEAAPQRGEVLLDLRFQSSVNMKYAYILRLLETIRANWSMTPEEQKKVELCLDEAIQNAIIWGNKEDPGKKVQVRLWKEDGRWGVTVSDEGEGFTKEKLPDYESEEFLWQDHGRGIFILLNYLDEVTYYDSGRTLVLKS